MGADSNTATRHSPFECLGTTSQKYEDHLEWQVDISRWRHVCVDSWLLAHYHCFCSNEAKISTAGSPTVIIQKTFFFQAVTKASHKRSMMKQMPVGGLGVGRAPHVFCAVEYSISQLVKKFCLLENSYVHNRAYNSHNLTPSWAKAIQFTLTKYKR